MSASGLTSLALEEACVLANGLEGSPPWTRAAVGMLLELCHGDQNQFERAATLASQGASAAGYAQVSESTIQGLASLLKEDLEGTWFESAIQELGSHAFGVLVAVAKATDPARVSVVASTCGLSVKAADNVLRRLAASGWVERTSRGTARVAVPGMRAYLQEWHGEDADAGEAMWEQGPHPAM